MAVCALMLASCGSSTETEEQPPTVLAAVCLSDPAATANLCLVDTVTGKTEVVVDDIALASAIEFSAATQRVVFTTGEGHVAILHLAEGGNDVVEQLPMQGWSPTFVSSTEIAAISPDRTSIVVWDTATNELGLETVVSGTGSTDPDDRIDGFAIALSSTVFVELSRDLVPSPQSADEIKTSFVVIEDGVTRTLVEAGSDWVGKPDVDPSGTRLAVTINGVISITDLELNVIIELSSSDWVSTTPRWSPTGKHVVWLANAVDNLGGVDGPVVLMWSGASPRSSIKPILGSASDVLTGFPVFPDW